MQKYEDIKGTTMTVSQWARKIGISSPGLAYRLNKNWSINKSLSINPKNYAN